MVKLRLKRMGRKSVPIYKIVAADSRSPRDGRFIEAVGYYNPHNDPMVINLKEDRVLHWLKNGAKPTDTVRSLLKREGIIMKMSLIKRNISQEKIEGLLNKFQESKTSKLEREKARKIRQKQNRAKKKETSEKKEEPKAE